jgi:hypothetical protein
MKRTIGILAFALCFFAVAAFGTEKAVNAYKTHKLTPSTVMISCNDEREPVVKKLDGPFVLITCTETK